MTHVAKTSKRKCVLLLPEVSPGEKCERLKRQVSGGGSRVLATWRARAGPIRGTFGVRGHSEQELLGTDVFKAGSCLGGTVWCFICVPLSSCGVSDIVC